MTKRCRQRMAVVSSKDAKFLKEEDFREWDTLHRDIIRCLARHIDPHQYPELRLVNKHWRQACDTLTTHVSITNHAVSLLGSPSIPLETAIQRFPSLNSLVVWKLRSQDFVLLRRLQKLTLLDIGGTLVDDQSIQHISSLTKLTTLQLWETDVGDEGVKFLADMKDLAVLNLRDSKISSTGMSSVAQLTNLISLNLDRTEVGDAGALHFPVLQKLQRLSLWHTPIGDEGAFCLSHLSGLTRLNLGYTRVTQRGIQFLTDLTNLTHLELWGVQTPPQTEEDMELF